MIAHVRNGELIRTFQGNVGRVECENGDVVSPPVAGYVNGNDSVVPYVVVTVDNSTANDPDPKQTHTVLFDGERVVKTITISDHSSAEIAANMRVIRDDKLASTDWITSKAVDRNARDGLGVQIPLVWLDYRQALRDITNQDGFPYNVIWPQEP